MSGLDMRVWAIPLAERGFFPISENNRVFWYLEDFDTNEIVAGPFKTKYIAEHWGSQHWEVVKGDTEHDRS